MIESQITFAESKASSDCDVGNPVAVVRDINGPPCAQRLLNLNQTGYAVAARELLADLSQFDFDNPIAPIEAIRELNRQRFEMEQLTAIIAIQPETGICVGYKDVGNDEFWVRGHFPDMPLMPGVVMLEAMAQQCSYHATRENLVGENSLVGFGGVEHCRFRGPVRPGDRLILITKMVKVRPRRMIVCDFQGVVGEKIVVEGAIRGIAIPVDSV